MLGELSVVEQRYLAVREVLDSGATVTDVALRYGGGPENGSPLVGPLRQWRSGCSGRPQFEA
jgi:transposase-like protein